MLLARLGLRAGEVAALRLDDIDWRAGELGDRGKGDRASGCRCRPTSVQAIVAYLRDGRPATALDRSVFVRVRAPHRALTHRRRRRRSCVAAGGRAGLAASHAHRLRHTAATADAARRRAVWPRSARCCATAALDARRSTPRSTATRCARWPRPWPRPGARHERRCAARWPTTWRCAARWATSSSAPRSCWRQFVDLPRTSAATTTVTDRHGAGVGDAAGRRRPRLVGAPAVGRCAGSPRYLHTLDPATRCPPRELLPQRPRRADAVPVLRRRDRAR